MKFLKLALIAAALSTLAGCAGRPPLTNDMVIAEAMKCEAVQLPWRPIYNYDGTVRDVMCMPRSITNNPNAFIRSPTGL